MPRLSRDSVSLSYEEAGSGLPPVILVHGWACDRSFMAPQFEHFRCSHRTVAVDLRGHGESDCPDQDYRIDVFADDLAWMIRELALERPVCIGHSMGGAVVLELAARWPDALSAIVLLDTAVLPAPAVWTGVQPVIAGLRTSQYRDVLREFLAGTFFLPTDDVQRKTEIIDAMLTPPQHVLASAFEGIFLWDSDAAAARCRVPALYIASTRPRGDVARLHELCPQLVHGQIVSAGHFLQLEVPEQVNAMIDRFLALNVPRSNGSAQTEHLTT
jgi:pimeloyl-ACP methyl ester carboxylesterase